MSDIFRRPTLASQLCAKLITPTALDLGYRSGLFIAGQRRIGKTTFLRHDLIPALSAAGAVVVYVDLWTDLQVNPAKLLIDEVRRTLKELETPRSSLAARLSAIRDVNIDLLGVKFGFDVDKVGDKEGATLAEAFSAVVQRAKTNLVLIIDEVQHALTSEEGLQLLFALKAARDAINKTPDTPGHFLFIGTGSHRAKVAELTARRQQAFDGAVSLNYPVLELDYVEYLMEQIRPVAERHGRVMPSPDAAWDAFMKLGHRPEELHKAFRALMAQETTDHTVDQTFGIIAATLRGAAADLELERLRDLGRLANVIFDKIAMAGAGTKGLFTVQAAEQYSQAIGREVKVEEIQPVVLALLDENLVMRGGHGLYAVSDPFVQQIWIESRDTTLFPPAISWLA